MPQLWCLTGCGIPALDSVTTSYGTFPEAQEAFLKLATEEVGAVGVPDFLQTSEAYREWR